MRAFPAVVALSLLVAPLAVAEAQDRTAQQRFAQERLDSGSVVRLQPDPHARTWTGRLHGMAGDTIWVTSLGATGYRGRGRAVVVQPGVARLEVSPDYDAISRRRHRTILASGVVMALLASAGREPD